MTPPADAPRESLPATTAAAAGDANAAGDRALPAALAAAAIAAGLAWAVAAAWRPMPLVHAAGWLVTGLVALPLLFASALAAVAAALSALLALLALPHGLLGRPTGLGAAVAAIWDLPRGIVPGYLAALRRVRRPRLWGACAGFVAGTAAFVTANGFQPPNG